MFAFRVALGFFAGLIAVLPPEASDAGEQPGLSSIFADLGIPKNRGEFSNGFDATGTGWSTYSTAVFALSGPLDHDGWRLKASGFYSSYRYDTRDNTVCRKIHDVGRTDPNPTLDKICDSIANNPPQGSDRDLIVSELAPYGLGLSGDQIIAITPHQATQYHLGIAPGYQTTFGALIVKAYLGLAFEHQDVAPPDDTKTLLGGYWGAQSWLEAWLPLSETIWVSTDASYFTGTASYSAAMKLGYKPLSWLTVGPELATYGDEDDVSGRAGAFLQFDAVGVQTTIAGGVSGNYRDNPGAYGSANFYLKF